MPRRSSARSLSAFLSISKPRTSFPLNGVYDLIDTIGVNHPEPASSVAFIVELDTRSRQFLNYQIFIFAKLVLATIIDMTRRPCALG